MKKILFVNACLRSGSRTLVLARRVLERLGGEVEEVDMSREDVRPLDTVSLALRDELVRAGDYSHPMFRYARQYARADEIVAAAPCWDLSFPAALKIYYEAVMVLGLTFRYDEQGVPAGLCRAGRLTYVTTSGGPFAYNDLGWQYIKALAQVYHGIPEVRCFAADGLDVVGADVDGIMAKTLAEIDGHFSDRTLKEA